MDQGSTDNHSPVNNFAPTVTKFCVMWEGQALPHDTKFGNCRDKIVDSKVFPSWSLIHGSSWSGLIKVEPGIWLAGRAVARCPVGSPLKLTSIITLCVAYYGSTSTRAIATGIWCLHLRDLYQIEMYFNGLPVWDDKRKMSCFPKDHFYNVDTRHASAE